MTQDPRKSNKIDQQLHMTSQTHTHEMGITDLQGY
jgi:hypothetical protein